MTYIPVTPFRRAVDAACLEGQRLADRPIPPEGVDKWEALRELATAKDRIGISDRSLAVLQALLTFLPGSRLVRDAAGQGDAASRPEPFSGGADRQGRGAGAVPRSDRTLVVHPSNATLSARLNGMPGSTLRRHLAALVDAGLIVRRDSPNGKRFVRRGRAGEAEVYGFDLSPLAVRFVEFCQLAESVRADLEALSRLRRMISLMRRDLAALIAYGAEIEPDSAIWQHADALCHEASQAIRRRDPAGLLDLEGRLAATLDQARDALSTQDPGAGATQNEHHQHSSKKEISDSEPCLEKASLDGSSSPPNDIRHSTRTDSCDNDATVIDDEVADDRPPPPLSLSLVLTACPEITEYIPGAIRHWHDLVRAAEVLRPMLGISPSAWSEAVSAMGPEAAAATLAAIMQRGPNVRSPGGYLRHLAAKAASGTFTPSPMVMANLQRQRSVGSQL